MVLKKYKEDVRLEITIARMDQVLSTITPPYMEAHGSQLCKRHPKNSQTQSALKGRGNYESTFRNLGRDISCNLLFLTLL